MTAYPTVNTKLQKIKRLALPHLEVRFKPKTFQDRCLGLGGQPNPFDRRLTASQPVELRSILGK